MAKIRTAPTPEKFATVWSGELEKAVRSVAGRTRVTRAQAERIGDDDPQQRIYRDNVLNYLDAHDINSTRIERLIDSGYRHALREGERVAGANNRISLTEARGMALDLRDDFRVLRGRAPLEPEPNAAPSSQEVFDALAAPIATLGEWWESGDNGVNVSAAAFAGAETIEAAFASAPAHVPWTVNERNLEMLDARDADAIAQFNQFAQDALNGFMEDARPEVPAFMRSVAEIFGPLSEVRLGYGHDLGGAYLFGKTSDGYTMLNVQPYRDG
jgi:hypothetical protein